MKKIVLLLVASMFAGVTMYGQDTFSIVAADSTTREVGAAGASCVNLLPFGYPSDFLSELFPDTGAINSQASYLPANQANARARMRAGDNPAQILDWVNTNDAGSDSTVRQYGVVRFNGAVAEARAYTGSGCMDTKYHRTGKVKGIAYSIQGNILSGQHIIDSMEARFVNASGDIRCRLMAALQGANEVGADSRCTTYVTSSLFSFIKVSQPGDAWGAPSFKLGVITDGTKGEPIDSLQKLFDAVHSCPVAYNPQIKAGGPIRIYPNPSRGQVTITIPVGQYLHMTIRDAMGRNCQMADLSRQRTIIPIGSLLPGLYSIEVSGDDIHIVQKLLIE